MSAIRPLRPEDIPQVASLYELVMGSGSRTPRPGLVALLREVLLDHPWADPEIPSLVYTDADDRIVSFVGSHVRRLCVDGRPVRASYAGQLMSEPAVRDRGIGALLLRRFLAGRQDVSITDSAGLDVRLLWERLGAATVSLGSHTWVRFFEPFRFGVERAVGRDSVWKPFARSAAPLLDAVAKRAGGKLLRVPKPPTIAEELTPRALLEHLPAVAKCARVRPDYDENFLAWLFLHMAGPTNSWGFYAMEGPSTDGSLVRRLVRDAAGKTLGWYVAYLPRHGIGDVQQLAARDQNVGAVFDHLLHDAAEHGTALLQGRMEPHLCETVWERHCVIRRSARFLVHSRDASLVDAIMVGDGVLTRMDGEWWVGPRIAGLAGKGGHRGEHRPRR